MLFSDAAALLPGQAIDCVECKKPFNKIRCPYADCAAVAARDADAADDVADTAATHDAARQAGSLAVFRGTDAKPQIEGGVKCRACKRVFRIEEGGVVAGDECRIKCCHCQRPCMYKHTKESMDGSALLCTHADCGKAFKCVRCPNSEECGKDNFFLDVDEYQQGTYIKCQFCDAHFNKVVCPHKACRRANVYMDDNAVPTGLKQKLNSGFADSFTACVTCGGEFTIDVTSGEVTARGQPKHGHNGGGAKVSDAEAKKLVKPLKKKH
jgi:hypothetical protein